MAMFDYSGPKFDFAPLANLADPIIDQMEKRRAGEELQKYVAAQLGGQSLAGLAPPAAPSAPTAAPAAPSMGAAMAPNQRAMRMPADPETERKFLATVAEGGLTNPIGRAALAAHVNAESGFSPANFTRTWSDPSESGQPGTSGGALSWRGDRLTKMLQATRGSEDPVVAQAKYALVENPDVTMALQNAKSLEEAHSVLANSQRYAGYDRPGGENARRLALAQNYLPKVGGSEVANLPIAGGATAQFVVPQGDRTPATTEVKPGVGQGPAAVGSGVSPEQRARIMAGVASTVPAVRAAALAELHQITQPKNPMSLGNGIIYDPVTKKVTDFSETQKKPEKVRIAEEEARNPAFKAYMDAERAQQEKVAKAGSGVDEYGQKYGPPPKDTVWQRKPDGTIALDDRGAPKTLTIGDARKKELDAEKAATAKEATQEQSRTILSEDIDRSLNLISKSRFPLTGVGSVISGVPGTPAHDLRTTLDAVRSNVGLDRLQAMRDASKTGSTSLGQVTQGEHKLLQAVMGSLEQSQSKEQIIYNLKRLKVAQEEIVHRGLGDPSRLKERLAELRISNNEAKAAGLLDGKNNPMRQPGDFPPGMPLPGTPSTGPRIIRQIN
jgi:hypothetical protein